MIRNLLIISLLLIICISRVESQTITPLFDYWKYYSDHENTQYKQLSERAFNQLNARKKIITDVRTKEDWENRIPSVREKLNRILGPFPEKTPLNPEITGTLQGDGFKVEKVIYESQPGFYVTAALFIPSALQGKAPAVIYCSGHTFEGFRSKVYQHVIINLVKKGFIVLAFDPVGQGERLQYLDDAKTGSIFRTPTHEHSYPGGQCFITGTSLAKHMIWDGIRSIDYLVSRPEVDPARIGITGRSGGGTQSAYIAAMDPRIKASAPECYITGFEYIFKTIGPQDAEQNIPLFLEEGLDHADLIEVRMPAPTLIVSTTDDFFSIQGARETFSEAKTAYEVYGFPENIQMSEDDAGHESTLKNRVALYRFFQKHLELPGPAEDLEVTIFDPADLKVTETGQLKTSIGSETIFSLNLKEARNKTGNLSGENSNESKLRSQIIRLTGYQKPESEKQSIFSGRVVYDSYILEKFMIPKNKNHLLPVFVMKPLVRSNGKSIFIFNPEGKISEMKNESLADWLVGKGYLVILPDLTGFGELGPGYLKGDAYMEHTSYNQWFAGILTGKSPVAIRMEDMDLITEFVVKQYPEESRELFGIARDVLSSDLLHYNTLENKFSGLALIRPLVSHRSLVLNERYHPKYIQSSVRGSIEFYDLPDLAALQNKLIMLDICDQESRIMENPTVHPEVLRISESFNQKNKEKDLLIYTSGSQTFEEIFNAWLK